MGFENGNLNYWNVSSPVGNSTYVSCVNSVQGNCHAQIEGGDEIVRVFYQPLATDPNCFVKSWLCLSFDYRVTILNSNISAAELAFEMLFSSPYLADETWSLPLTSLQFDSSLQSVWTTHWIAVPSYSFPVKFIAYTTGDANYLELDNFQWKDGKCL